MKPVVNLNPAELGPAVGFSHVSRAGSVVAIGGQVGCDERGVITNPGDVASQFRVAIERVRKALEAAGCRPADVVKIGYYVTDLDAYRAASKSIGEAYRNVFGKHYPASTLLGVQSLFDPQAMVEIDCLAIASKPEG